VKHPKVEKAFFEEARDGGKGQQHGLEDFGRSRVFALVTSSVGFIRLTR
jgi:hypothetical protein